jgi:membrane protein DedA with SNARE-associated domain
VAIFLGTFAEGETLLLLGGYAAHLGYLELPGVIAAAFAAALASDQMYFHLGRRHGARLLSRYPQLRSKVDIALHRVERHGTLVVLAMRFVWGLRIALPLAIGVGPMSARRFLMVNFVSAALWSCVFGLLGFGASQLLARLSDDLHRHENWVIGAFLLLACGALAWRWWRVLLQTESR